MYPRVACAEMALDRRRPLQPHAQLELVLPDEVAAGVSSQGELVPADHAFADAPTCDPEPFGELLGVMGVADQDATGNRGTGRTDAASERADDGGMPTD